MIVALDSNVLGYFVEVARGPADLPKIAAVQSLLQRAADHHLFVAPVQSHGELYNLLLKSGASRKAAQEVVNAVQSAFPTHDTTGATMMSAIELATAHQLQIWDAVMICAAKEAGARVLLSEDMQDGFIWRGVTILNPLGERAEQVLFG
jgi:predicted nucleic acid-binding protein